MNSSPHVAIVTGANHGIGAATAERLAAAGTSVLITYLRGRVTADPETPERYQENRMTDGKQVAVRIRRRGGRALAVEADLLDDTTPAMLFDLAERELGPVDVLVNNATGWAAGDSFVAGSPDAAGRTSAAVTGELFDRTFGVDARAAALMIAAFDTGRVPNVSGLEFSLTRASEAKIRPEILVFENGLNSTRD